MTIYIFSVTSIALSTKFTRIIQSAASAKISWFVLYPKMLFCFYPNGIVFLPSSCYVGPRPNSTNPAVAIEPVQIQL
jgi:hypothetical protein